MTMNQDTERAAFEAHMLSLNACTRLHRQSSEVGGEYRTVTVERAWQIWQAARRATGSQFIGWMDADTLHVMRETHASEKTRWPIYKLSQWAKTTGLVRIFAEAAPLADRP